VQLVCNWRGEIQDSEGFRKLPWNWITVVMSSMHLTLVVCSPEKRKDVLKKKTVESAGKEQNDRSVPNSAQANIRLSNFQKVMVIMNHLAIRQ